MPAVELCGCDGCREYRAVHARLSREVPYGERQAKREADRAAQRRYEDAEAALAGHVRGAA